MVYGTVYIMEKLTVKYSERKLKLDELSTYSLDLKLTSMTH